MRIILKSVLLIIAVLMINMVNAQYKFPEEIEKNHPRLMSSDITKEQILHEIATSEKIKESYESFKSNVSGYVKQSETDPEWMVSRLQMYWKSHATDIFVKGNFYSHAKGKAPVPTVRLNGGLDYVINYRTPSLENVRPYMEDKRGLWLQNKNTGKWEWAKISQTGRIIGNINKTILGYARDAAIVYYIEGDERYAKFAAHIFDVYMQGLYYRNVPKDLTNSRIQHLIGYTAFQVIKEESIEPLVGCYDYLYYYLKENAKDKLDIYSTSFKKLAEQIIKNGVPDNNWDLIQAGKVLSAAFMLEDNSYYKDGKGCQYFLDRIFNKDEEKQWSITKLLSTGYDKNTGIWGECPGYSIFVTKDFTHFMCTVQDALNIDVLSSSPILYKAVNILPQYLFPNKYIVAFGDTHYGRIPTLSMIDMVKNAQRFGKPDQEKKYTAMMYMMSKGNGEKSFKSVKAGNEFMSLLNGDKVKLDKDIKPADFSDYVTSSFYAPNVSWLVLRNGFDSKHGLMISQAGALGNHMHSNGIAMELYGKNYVLGVEGGRGSSYRQPDYHDYYSQFPAHNTVSVNGISGYGAMRLNHPFILNNVYPKSEKKTGYYPGISFSDISFLEPKTNADQNRIMSIVRTGETSGYYIDIFRSKCRNADDKYHDYFYHNIGQKLTLSNTKNETFKLTPSKKLSTEEGDSKAYDYIKDKTSVKTTHDFKARFDLSIPGEEKVYMNMWMRGDKNREVFKVKSPRSDAFRNSMIPNDIANEPLHTVIVRNTGEAWNHPFVAIYEPTTDSEPSVIKNINSFKADCSSKSFVGLKIDGINNRTDYVFSSDINAKCSYRNMFFKGKFGIISEDNDTTILFLGSGNIIENNGCSIEIPANESSAVLKYTKNSIFLNSKTAVVITIPDIYKRGDVILNYGTTKIYGKRIVKNKKRSVSFIVPAIEYQRIDVIQK